MQITSKFTIGVHILAAIAFLGENESSVTSSILSGSIGANPVIVRNVMGDLKRAGLIDVSQGKSGITLKKRLDRISFYDVYNAVDCVNENGLFHFHENPNPNCPIGRNIHEAMDKRLELVQRHMEDEMKRIAVSDVLDDILKQLAQSESERS